MTSSDSPLPTSSRVRASTPVRRVVPVLAGAALAGVLAATLLAPSPAGSPTLPAPGTAWNADRVASVSAAPVMVGTADKVAANGALVEAAVGFEVQKWQGKVPRWNPCAGPHTVKISMPGLKKADRPKAVGETRWAVKKLAKATGVKFRFVGKTKEIPHAKRQVRSADIVISYAKPSQAKSMPLAGGTIGYGGSWWAANGARMSGFVVIDTVQAKSLPLTRDGGLTRPSVLMHELGHVVGLEHVERRGEQMYPSISVDSPATYGPGDRQGLRRVGAPAGCVR